MKDLSGSLRPLSRLTSASRRWIFLRSCGNGRYERSFPRVEVPTGLPASGRWISARSYARGPYETSFVRVEVPTGLRGSFLRGRCGICPNEGARRGLPMRTGYEIVSRSRRTVRPLMKHKRSFWRDNAVFPLTEIDSCDILIPLEADTSQLNP